MTKENMTLKNQREKWDSTIGNALNFYFQRENKFGFVSTVSFLICFIIVLTVLLTPILFVFNFIIICEIKKEQWVLGNLIWKGN